MMGVNDTPTTTLYIRAPFKITDELKIKELHPDILRVKLPRQKNTRWCLAEFEDFKKCLDAFQQLRKVKIDGKALHCSLATTAKSKKKK